MDSTPVRLLTAAERAMPDGAAKAVEDDDPYELVGMRFPVAPGVDADHELGRAFVEEYALLGWREAKVRMLFETPQFAGAHDIYRRRGSAFIDQILGEVFRGTQSTEEH